MSRQTLSVQAWASGLIVAAVACVAFAAPRASAQDSPAGRVARPDSAVTPGTTLDSAIVVPNPYNVSGRTYGLLSDAKTGDQIEFYRLPSPCSIRIYSSDGNFVYAINDIKASAPGRWATVAWNGRNADNQYVVSDVYIYVVTSPTLGSKVGKLVIIR